MPTKGTVWKTHPKGIAIFGNYVLILTHPGAIGAIGALRRAS